MRIIGGVFGGRRFYPPGKGWPTRPTTDVAKEALFNILINRIDIEPVRFLDLFGGTGSHSFEMISRGCRDVTYVDNFKPACAFVSSMAGTLNVEAHLSVVCTDAFRFCASYPAPFDYIFAGPPYGLTTLDTIPEVIFRNMMLKPGGLLVLEHNPSHTFTEARQFAEVRKYGQTHFSFFVHPG